MAHTFNIVETIGRNSRLRGESWFQRMVSNSCPLNLCPSGTASLGAVQRAIRAPAHIAIWAIHAPSVVYERLPTPYPSAINVVTRVQNCPFSCRSFGPAEIEHPRWPACGHSGRPISPEMRSRRTARDGASGGDVSPAPRTVRDRSRNSAPARFRRQSPADRQSYVTHRSTRRPRSEPPSSPGCQARPETVKPRLPRRRGGPGFSPGLARLPLF